MAERLPCPSQQMSGSKYLTCVLGFRGNSRLEVPSYYRQTIAAMCLRSLTIRQSSGVQTGALIVCGLGLGNWKVAAQHHRVRGTSSTLDTDIAPNPLFILRYLLAKRTLSYPDYFVYSTACKHSQSLPSARVIFCPSEIAGPCMCFPQPGWQR
jgi:hypothetical protein